MSDLDPVVVDMSRDSLRCYATAVHPKYQVPKHVEMLLQALESLERGDIDRLMITLPPRHSKSETVTRSFIPWYYGKHPDHEIILACNTQSLATKMGGNVKSVVDSPTHKAVFPEFQLSHDTHAKTEFATTKGGELFAGGVGTTSYGRGADIFCIDDPHKGREDTTSVVQLESVYEWYRAVATTRLSPNGKIILVSTRWSETDLMGWLLDKNEQEEVDNWKIMNFPAIAEEDEGWRKEGDALWPERWDLEKLFRKKRAKGSWDWAAQYQQTPAAVEGNIILRKWWKYYNWGPQMVADRRIVHDGLLTQPYIVVQSWDTAMEDDEQNDYSVCETWLHTAKGEYLLDVWRKKVLMPDLFRAAQELAIYWRANTLVIEKKASGHALVQQLQAATRLPIIPFEPHGSKEIRMRAVSYLIESGRCFLPVQAPFLKDFLNELSSFPASAKKDQVDACSQYLHWVKMKQEREEQFEADDMDPQSFNPLAV
jgi:predicted phage terminase large subunit-like protein